jgi:hypothetical protein
MQLRTTRGIYIAYLFENKSLGKKIHWEFYVLLTVLPSRYNSCKWPTWRTIPSSICLFQFTTYFEQLRAHHQENQLYQYNTWYVSICVGDRLVCRSGRKSSFPTCILDGQSNTYQVLYWYKWFSWWWAQGCSKHVENWNKHIEKTNSASSWLFTRITHWEVANKQWLFSVHSLPTIHQNRLNIFIESVVCQCVTISNYIHLLGY